LHVWKLEDVRLLARVLAMKASLWKSVTAITHSTGTAQWTLKDGPSATPIMQLLVCTALAILFTVYKWLSAVLTKIHDGHSAKRLTGLHRLMQPVGSRFLIISSSLDFIEELGNS